MIDVAVILITKDRDAVNCRRGSTESLKEVGWLPTESGLLRMRRKFLPQYNFDLARLEEQSVNFVTKRSNSHDIRVELVLYALSHWENRTTDRLDEQRTA